MVEGVKVYGVRYLAEVVALLTRPFDPYPFILLNLAFSTQAAYAAPLILLAQTRQADRDKVSEERVEKRHDEMERLAQERVAAIKALMSSQSKWVSSCLNSVAEWRLLKQASGAGPRRERGTHRRWAE